METGYSARRRRPEAAPTGFTAASVASRKPAVLPSVLEFSMLWVAEDPDSDDPQAWRDDGHGGFGAPLCGFEDS